MVNIGLRLLVLTRQILLAFTNDSQTAFINISQIKSNVFQCIRLICLMRYITLWLAGIAAIVFIAQTVVGTSFFVLDSSLVWHQPWRLVTAIFAHAYGHCRAFLAGPGRRRGFHS